MTQSFGRRALCLVATFTLVNLVVINHPKFKSFLWLPLIFQDVEDVGSASDVLRSSSITTPVSSTIATTTTTTTATTTHTTGGTTSSESILAGSSSAWSTDAAGFPRWGDANGIELDGIFKFVEFASQFDTPRDLLHPTDYPIPNVLYVFGKASSGGTGRAVIAAERGKWKLVPRQFRQERYEPFEHLMMTALNRLLEVASKSSEISHGNSARWSRLRELVRPAPLHEGKQQQHPQPQDQNSIPNETNADIIVEENGGIPMIVHLPDNRYCNYRNYVWNATDDSVEPKPTTRFLNVPIFHVAGAYDPIDCNYTFPIPTYSMIDFVLQNERKASSSSWDDIFREQDRTYAWKSKLSKVVWRGSNTGVVPVDRHLCEKMNNDTTPMRLRMIHAANSNHSNYIASARLFDVKRVPGKMQKQARKQQDGSTATATASSFYLPMQDVQKYKAVLDVDGNSWSERFGKLLCMNSVVIKVEPEFVDYFMPTLQPWKHYVPVKMDSSDLHDVAQYVLDPRNDKEMLNIVRNANRWCSRQMKWDQIVEDFLDILTFYVEQLDKFDAGWHDRWNSWIMHFNTLVASTTQGNAWKTFQGKPPSDDR